MTKSLGEQNYEQFASRYAAAVETKPHNAHYDRPAVLSLLPDLTGKRALDVGCGPGIYAEELLKRGAEVVAFDVTPAFVEIARQRLGERATVLHADLQSPLTFAVDSAFDLVLAPLVLDYIADWNPVFSEFHRVLKPGGVLVFSVGHPYADYTIRASDETDYFALEDFSMAWSGFGDPDPIITLYRRPLQAMINPLVGSGFRVDHVLEPQPTPEFAQHAPDDYAKLMREPGFICFRASKS